MSRQSPKSQMYTLRIIHFSLMFFPVVIAIFALIYNMNRSAESTSAIGFLQFIPTILFLLVIFFSGKIFNIVYNNNVGVDPSLKKKMSAYTYGHLMQMALYETVGVFAVIVSIISGSFYNLGLVLLIILIFFNKTPTVVKLEGKLNLTPEERKQFKL